MSRRNSWKAASLATLVGLTLSMSGAALLALIGGMGPLMGSPILGFAAPYDRRAFNLLSKNLSGGSHSAASAECHRALSLSPYDNTARLRLAYMDSLQPETFDRALAHLDRSYDLTPYDYTIARWRIDFSLNDWGSLSPEERRLVFSEAIAFGKVGSQDVDVRGTLRAIRDPRGRLAAALWLHALKD